jgi:deoxyribonuclease (pyrimidine dimer)
MVRINIIDPCCLADQHLIAEYDEILMLLGYVKRYPKLNDDIPEKYRLGKGHIKFFKNKLKYLKKRHDMIKEEMKKRGFEPKVTIDLTNFNKELNNDWEPKSEDKFIIKNRLLEKIGMKPKYYRYYGEYRSPKFFVKLIEEAE